MSRWRRWPRRETDDVDFDAVADELYALAPTAFIAARNNGAKQARGEGDRELATQIAALRKPTTAAWIVNQLVREHADEIQALLDLGRELRDVVAELGADELREMTRRRYRLVSALVQQARALGHARGIRISDEAAQGARATLEATLSDPASAEQVASARLSDALQVSGFGVAGAVGVGAGQGSLRLAERRSPNDGATVTDLDVERERRKTRQRAEHEVEVTGETLRRARDVLLSAEADLRTVEEQREQIAGAVERLRRELDQAVASLEQIQRLETSARNEINAAERDASSAEERHATARSHLDELT